MPDAFGCLLCLLLCRHNRPGPNVEENITTLQLFLNQVISTLAF